jgi:hypothetical protein
MSLVLQSSGGGSVTIAEPTTASNFTQTLPAADGTSILANGSGDLQMNSGYGSNATAYGCRAWVNFNGTGTVAIRASGNVSSITDNGTGDYTVNFTTAMPDVNYSAPVSAYSGTTANRSFSSPAAMATGSLGVVSANSTGTATDFTYVIVAVFR